MLRKETECQSTSLWSRNWSTPCWLVPGSVLFTLLWWVVQLGLWNDILQQTREGNCVYKVIINNITFLDYCIYYYESLTRHAESAEPHAASAALGHLIATSWPHYLWSSSAEPKFLLLLVQAAQDLKPPAVLSVNTSLATPAPYIWVRCFWSVFGLVRHCRQGSFVNRTTLFSTCHVQRLVVLVGVLLW